MCFQRRYRFESGDIANATEKEETSVVNEEVIEWKAASRVSDARFKPYIYIYIYVTVLPPEICALVLFFFSLPAFFSTECNSERRNLYFRIENCAPMKTVTSGG